MTAIPVCRETVLDIEPDQIVIVHSEVCFAQTEGKTMYKNILVPLDPSHLEKADETLDLAEHLKADDGQITLLSVVEEIPVYVASQIPNELLVNARSYAKDSLEKLVKDRKMKAQMVVKTGHAAATIKSVQREKQCDLIIISSHKPNNVDYLLGSTASKVVRRAQCPVFVTR